MSSNIEVETRTRMRDSGLWGTIKMSMLGGETLFIDDYISKGEPEKTGFVSAPLGDITHLEVTPSNGYSIQSTGYIASTAGVTLDTHCWGFTKGLFGQNLFMLKTLEEGDIFISTFGAIDRHERQAGEHLVVDNYHLAALSDTCDYTVRMFGGLKSTILGGAKDWSPTSPFQVRSTSRPRTSGSSSTGSGATSLHGWPANGQVGLVSPLVSRRVRCRYTT